MALLLFSCCALGSVPLMAQNVAYTMYFEQPEEPPCVDEVFCVDVTVENFSNIAETRFNILWDSAVLEFVSVQDITLPGMTLADFNQTNAGTLNVDWEIEACESIGQGEGITLDDCMNQCRPTVFRLCFRTLSSYGGASEITVGPNRYTTKDNSNCVNLQTFVQPAVISTCVRPFIIDIADGQGNEGDLVCIDFRVNGMDSISSFQFPVVWDSTLATFESIIIPANLPNLNQTSFGTPINAAGVQEGVITVSWGSPPPQNSLTIADSTIIFQLCLRLKAGSCSRRIALSIPDEQPGQPFFTPEATNEFMGGFPDLAVGHIPGEIQVGACNPQGVQIAADCGEPVSLGDQVCVQVEAGGNFQNVTGLGFLMNWNPSLLQYTGVQGFGLPGLNAAGFNEANALNGVLGFSWNGTGQTRAEGDVLFEVCFDVIGLGGNSPFQFVNNSQAVGQINNAPSIGINPTNCEVTINQPPGVLIEVTDSQEAQPGDTLCFDFNVSGFDEVESMSFSVVFEPSSMEFILGGGIQNINLPGASGANFNLLGFGNGQILFDWTAPSATTLPDGTSIFMLCFTVPDDENLAGTCDELLIASDPLEAQATTTSSGGDDVGLTGVGGGYCLLSPNGFWLVGDEVEGDIRDTVCVPFKVGEFESVTAADFCVNWAPGSLRLVDVVDSGVIPGLNIDPGGQPVGSACFDFENVAGLSLADSTVVFELCFELVGPADTCYAVEVSDLPTPTVGLLDGPGSLLDLPGQVCINDRIFIDSVIVTQESCPGSADGTIRLVVSGGRPNYTFSWQLSPPRFTPFINNLSSGEVVVTVLDASGLSITDTIFVPVGGADLMANVGPNRIANCGDCSSANFIAPMATTVATNPNVVYQWTVLPGGGQICGATTTRTAFLLGPGRFVFEVRDTESGCSIRDTMELLAPAFPELEFNEEGPIMLTCDNPAAQLSIAPEANVDYNWTGPNGFTATTREITASEAGTYVLSAAFADSGCSATDSVLVQVNNTPPTISTQDTVFLGCSDQANLLASVAPGVTDFSARWLDANGLQVSDTLTYATDQAGLYVLEVTNDANGCVATDSTVVSLDETVIPEVSIVNDPAPSINCTGNPVLLDVIVSNADPSGVLPVWSSPDGGVLVAGTENSLTPSVSVPGTFVLTITDNSTGCTAMDTIQVVYDTIPPLAVAQADGVIGCEADVVTLDGTASDSGPNITYTWFSLEFSDTVGTNALEPVGAGGAYVLTVFDASTGCSSVDTAFVAIDEDAPPVFVSPAQSLTCQRDTVLLLASVDLPPGTFTINWVAETGEIALIQGDSLAIIDEPGVYTVTVINDLTGCEVSLTREIIENKVFPDISLTASSSFIDCNNPLVTLDGTGSTVSDSLVTVQYQWTVLQGAAEPPFNNITLQTEQGGLFAFSVRNVGSNCISRDTIEILSDLEEPTVMANTGFSLSCTSNQGTLDGSGSTVDEGFTYIWEVLQQGGVVIDTFEIGGPEVLSVPVSTPGLYRLRIVNNQNGCSGISTPPTLVTAVGEVPQIVFGEPTDIGVIEYDCNAPDTISVNFSISNDSLFTPTNLVYEWVGAVITDPNDPFNVGITGPGTYEIMVTDTSSGCVGLNELVVDDIREFPEIVLAEDSLSLNCIQDMVMLDGSASDSLAGVIFYEWLNAEGESLSTMATLDVSAPGTYQFVVENTENGCTAIDSVVVSEDTQAPDVLLAETADFTCISEEVLLSAAPTGDAADFDVEWTTVDGGTVLPVDGTLTANVDAPGTYQLLVTSLANGCDSLVVFEVAADTMPPAGQIATPNLLGCAGQTVTLDASSFGNNGEFEIEWSSADGEVSPPTGSLLVDVDAPGTYTVSVTSPENGCEAEASIVVELDPDAPVAAASTDNNELGCGGSVTLDGTGSSEGDNYDYEWVSVDAMGVPPLPTSVLTATVDEPGNYVLIVTNMNTGCADTSAAVSIILDPDLPTAAAQVDEVGCDGNAFVSANLPAGTTGQWTIAGTGQILNDSLSATEVVGLGKEPVELTWTISLEGCPDFSSATVIVTPELAPEAQNDMFTLPVGNTQTDFNVLDNDILTGVNNFNLALLGNPSIGSVTDAGNGNLSYTLTTTLFGPAQDEFRYQICNANCPELCDSALVQIMIQRDSMEIEVPNGITPNGDGLNDAFVFDQLLLNPDEYPNNELIIFNRWGDIVFKARPYGNDWQGTNMEGKNLPDGTYYYILRLDIGSGEILRGDVTILR